MFGGNRLDNDIKFLLDRARESRLYLAYMMVFQTGCTPSEILALTWSDINWKMGTVRIAKTLFEIRGKGVIKEETRSGGMRYVAISEDIKRELTKKRMKESHKKDSDLIFTNEKGEAWLLCRVNADFRLMMRAAGYGTAVTSIHSLRSGWVKRSYMVRREGEQIG